MIASRSAWAKKKRLNAAQPFADVPDRPARIGSPSALPHWCETGNAGEISL